MKIYFDGVQQPYDDTFNNWSVTKEVVIPSETEVLGIECKMVGGAKGILASTSAGLVTNASWTCSNNQNMSGWSSPGYEDKDGDFSAPQMFGNNGMAPWGNM